MRSGVGGPEKTNMDECWPITIALKCQSVKLRSTNHFLIRIPWTLTGAATVPSTSLLAAHTYFSDFFRLQMAHFLLHVWWHVVWRFAIHLGFVPARI